MSTKAISSVLEYLKGGKILGTKAPRIPAVDERILHNESTALRFKSYNPSLNKVDFADIYPERLLSPKSCVEEETKSLFHLVRCRDPKFFQFQDNYVLLFEDHKSMKKYYQSTMYSRIHNVRVKFNMLPGSDTIIPAYAHYAKNLESAFQGNESYFRSIKDGHPLRNLSEQDLSVLQKTIKPIEERSALIWNLPIHLKSHNVMDKFWFYDIKHCFKLFWDEKTGKTLHYVAFNEPVDCLKLKRNFHGVNFDDDSRYKLLIETLGDDS